MLYFGIYLLLHTTFTTKSKNSNEENSWSPINYSNFRKCENHNLKTNHKFSSNLRKEKDEFEGSWRRILYKVKILENFERNHNDKKNNFVGEQVEEMVANTTMMIWRDDLKHYFRKRVEQNSKILPKVTPGKILDK